MDKNILELYEEFAYDEAKLKTPKKESLEFKLLFGVTGLSEESGEVAGKIKKWVRDHEGEKFNLEQQLKIEKELGDCLFYMGYIAKLIGSNLNHVLYANMEKIRERRANNTIHGSGDDR